MRKSLIVGLFIGLMTCVVMADDVKIGYVDSQRIFAEYQEYQDAQIKFDKDLESWNTQGDQMKRDIEELKSEIEGQSLILSAEKKKEKENMLLAKQDTLNQFLNATFGPDGKAERRMAELSKPVHDKIISIIERIAIENNYSIVFDVGTVNIAYAKKSLDITDDVLVELAAEE
ncbi:MAG: OmpH family outer membrane protein [candidate division Zixibacteria bacterium]|nr:OmpH family outer membrane protein [candidate division Zixibacteria bacterium]